MVKLIQTLYTLMLIYDWTCQNCNSCVSAGHENCPECGCPSRVSARELTRIRQLTSASDHPPRIDDFQREASKNWENTTDPLWKPVLLRTYLHPATYHCIHCTYRVSDGDFFCSHCGHEYTDIEVEQMIQTHKDSFGSDLLKITVPLLIFGSLFSAADEAETDWIVGDTTRELHPHVYNCVACLNKVAWGDAFCRFCGIRFSQDMCRHMNQHMQWLARETLPSLLLLSTFVGALLVLALF